MKVEDIKKYCLSKHKAYEDYPFGEIPICYKFAIAYGVSCQWQVM